MKVLQLICIVILFVFSVSCSKSSEEAFISDFLQKKAELSELQDKITFLGDELGIDHEKGKDAEETEEVEKLLLEVKNMLTEREFQRLVSNRILVEEAFIRKEADDIKIENLSVRKKPSEETVFHVTFVEKHYKNGELNEEEEKNFEYTLEKTDDQYKISKIKPMTD